jgi:hypothetical protein
MKKSVEMTPRRKRQAMYLGLFAMGVLFALTNPGGAWLPIALAAALAIDEILYLIAKRRHAKKGGETSELIETTGVEVEKPEETDSDDSEDQ